MFVCQNRQQGLFHHASTVIIYEYQRTAVFADLLMDSVSRHGGQGCPPVRKLSEVEA